MNNKIKGSLVASAVMGLFLAGQAVIAADAPATKTAEVKCAGINACSGKGSCHSANNSCKGSNSCKGKGWVVAVSAEACTSQGGTVVTVK